MVTTISTMSAIVTRLNAHRSSPWKLLASILCVVTCSFPSEAHFELVSRHLDQCDENTLDPFFSASATGYDQWKSSLPTGQFTSNLYIPTASDPCRGLAFHWKIDQELSKIKIAVAAKADGWSAIGFSETGGMKGADIVYYKASTGELVDAHVLDGYARPVRDKIQDWNLTKGQVTDDGFIIFEAERHLVTNPGHEDHKIIDDSSVHVSDHRIIGAWGDEIDLSFHGQSVVRKSIQLFPSADTEAGDGITIFENEMAQRSDGSAFLKLENYTIPQVETTYERVCYNVSDLVDLGLFENSSSSTHIIGFQFMIDPSTVKYAHHIVLYGHSTHVGNGESCPFWSSQVLAVWTPGDDFVYFPNGMGLKVGNVPDSYNAFTLEYHIDNVDGDAGKIDNGSGVKIFYTNKSVEHEVGMVVMGDLNLDLRGEPIGQGKTKHQFTCPTECTEKTFYSVDEVTVIGEYHHMHEKGKRLVSEVFRGNTTVNTATVDYWDFDQNGAVQVRQKPYKLKKGDFYRTTCYFESYKNTKYGRASSDEMCMTFIYYYPKQSPFMNCSPESFQSYCGSSYSSSILESESNFDRAVTDANTDSSALPDASGVIQPLVRNWAIMMLTIFTAFNH